MTLIVALDALQGDTTGIERLARELCGLAPGLKLGWPNLLPAGARAVEAARSGCPSAMLVLDLKLADIGYTMSLIVRQLPRADAVIAHAFIGARGALLDLREELEARGQRLVLVASMSHPGSAEALDPCLDRLLSIVEEVGPWGVVAPATRPEIVRRARGRLGRGVKILSPGVGAQGARPGEALLAGADYEIVGRLITLSPDPRAAARRVLEAHRRALERRRGAP